MNITIRGTTIGMMQFPTSSNRASISRLPLFVDSTSGKRRGNYLADIGKLAPSETTSPQRNELLQSLPHPKLCNWPPSRPFEDPSTFTFACVPADTSDPACGHLLERDASR